MSRVVAALMPNETYAKVQNLCRDYAIDVDQLEKLSKF